MAYSEFLRESIKHGRPTAPPGRFLGTGEKGAWAGVRFEFRGRSARSVALVGKPVQESPVMTSAEEELARLSETL